MSEESIFDQPFEAQEPLTPEEESWLEHDLKARQEEPKRIEEAAKLLVTLISLAFTLLFGLSKAWLDGAGMSDVEGYLLKATFLCWVFACLFAFYVILPFPYVQRRDQVAEIMRVHQEVRTRKYRFLLWSIVLFGLGMVWLLVRVMMM